MVGSLPGVIRQDAISYYNLGEAMDLGKYEVIDWDDEEEQPDERLNTCCIAFAMASTSGSSLRCCQRNLWRSGSRRRWRKEPL
jgi:hypothetical protein